MAHGTGPRSDPTACTVIARQYVPDVAWHSVIEEALRSVSPDIQKLAKELWIHPIVHQSTRHRAEKIADRLHISIRTLYAWRDQFLIEVGSRAYSKGLIKEEEELKQ